MAEDKSTDFILRAIDEHGIATLTLNRPERLNAFNQEMVDQWADTLASFFSDPAVKVIIVTGAGRAFCSGGDAGGVQQRTQEGPIAGKEYMMNHIYRVARQMEQGDKPVIAAINGLARAGGFDMALMCDIRIAAESATFAESYINLGLISGGGGAYFLPRLIGMSKALELLWTGESITASEAEALGIISRAVRDDDLMRAAHALARKIAAQPSMAVCYYKRAAQQGLNQTLASHLDMVSSHLGILRQNPEHLDRMQALLNKQKK